MPESARPKSSYRISTIISLTETQTHAFEQVNPHTAQA